MSTAKPDSTTIVIQVEEAEAILKSVEKILINDGYFVQIGKSINFPSELTNETPQDMLGTIRYVRENLPITSTIILMSSL